MGEELPWPRDDREALQAIHGMRESNTQSEISSANTPGELLPSRTRGFLDGSEESPANGEGEQQDRE